MSLRLSKYIEHVQLTKVQRARIDGRLQLMNGAELELRLRGQLPWVDVGETISISASEVGRQFHPEELHAGALNRVSSRQSGVAHRISYRMALVATDVRQLRKERELDAIPTEERSCFAIEWFAQNGHMIAELIDPVVRCSDDRTLEPRPRSDFERRHARAVEIVGNDAGPATDVGVELQ